MRLVFAPEAGIAAFGGDPDNFQFPRWCLDMGVLRAYEDGKPAKHANFLKINFAGPAAGEPVFVSGHPGATDRLLTLAQLKQQRNIELPQWLLRYSEIRGRYIQFSQASPQNERITADPLNSLENAIKVRRKMLDALHEDSLLARKAAEAGRAARRHREGRQAQEEHRRSVERHRQGAGRRARAVRAVHLHRNGAGFQGRLVNYARTLVRGAAERDKPNGAALPRVHRRRAAAHRAAARRHRARLPRARGDPRSATASSACASG